MSIFSNLFKRIPFASLQSNAGAAFHTISSSVTSTTLSGNAPGGGLSSIFYRTKVRCYFPKPKEVKRIKVHGWNKRMSTPEGRRILMRRILKGRHVLSH